VIAALVERIALPPANTAMRVKREEVEQAIVSGSKARKKRGCSRVATKEEEAPDEPPRTPDVEAWGPDGFSRAEWLRKEREGKEEMTRLLASWQGMQPKDYIDFKARLGV